MLTAGTTVAGSAGYVAIERVDGELEGRGWVQRRRSAEDGRGNVAVLTDAGWDVVRSVAPGHVAAVRSAFFDPLEPGQTAALREALERVVDRLDPDSVLRAEPGAPA